LSHFFLITVYFVVLEFSSGSILQTNKVMAVFYLSSPSIMFSDIVITRLLFEESPDSDNDLIHFFLITVYFVVLAALLLPLDMHAIIPLDINHQHH
jgi:hypothetical protein